MMEGIMYTDASKKLFEIMVGDKVIFIRDDFMVVGKVNEIIANVNSSLLYGVISNNRIYYCTEEELKISK